MNHIDVSVIICVRNGAKTLRRQLDALAAQVAAPHFEVIVSDNGSTDDTVAVAEQWADENLGAVAELRIIDSSAKRGIPHARNVGAQAARGRMLAFCDADDAVDPGWVRALHASVESGLGGGRVTAIRPNGSIDHAAFGDALQQTDYLPHVSGCNFAITHEAFFDVGGFDESLPSYGCDDLEFSWRVQESGHLLVYVPDAIVNFTITPPTRVVKKEFLMAKARIAVAARHPASETRVPSLPHFVGHLAHSVALLPWRMIRPGGTRRVRWVRWTVDAAGRLSGYWTYFVRGDKHGPQLLPRLG
ncbi:glycosyltransferase family 2 protein [Tessaracoccus sp. Y1736]